MWEEGRESNRQRPKDKEESEFQLTTEQRTHGTMGEDKEIQLSRYWQVEAENPTVSTVMLWAFLLPELKVYKNNFHFSCGHDSQQLHPVFTTKNSKTNESSLLAFYRYIFNTILPSAAQGLQLWCCKKLKCSKAFSFFSAEPHSSSRHSTRKRKQRGSVTPELISVGETSAPPKQAKF